jgi:hypothetical protein
MPTLRSTFIIARRKSIQYVHMYTYLRLKYDWLRNCGAPPEGILNYADCVFIVRRAMANQYARAPKAENEAKQREKVFRCGRWLFCCSLPSPSVFALRVFPPLRRIPGEKIASFAHRQRNLGAERTGA